MRIGIAAGALALGVILATSMASCVPFAPSETPAPSVSTAPPDVDESQTAKPTPSDDPVADVAAVITVAGVDVDGEHVTVSGYVSGVIEDGGECVFEFSGTTGEVTAVSKGVADRATTSCGVAAVATSELSRGTWEVRLAYRSQNVDVVSEQSIVEVP